MKALSEYISEKLEISEKQEISDKPVTEAEKEEEPKDEPEEDSKDDEEDKPNPGKVTFDFSGMDNAKETIKSLVQYDGIDVDSDSVTVDVNTSNFNSTDMESIQDIMQQFYETARASQKSTNYENYAQKVKAFGKRVRELNDRIDSMSGK